MPEPTPTPGGVFLSYAREDTDAAHRIADALRSHGIEVWFDQAELRGGDTWDAKIRKQIRECSLFLAIISTNTQARGEGYFRREWKIAVERTHDMAAGIAFLVPVVIDDTAESEAMVPDEFMRVQWTRLPGALPTPQFVEQLKGLLGGRRKPILTAGRPRISARDLPPLPAGAGAPKAAAPPGKKPAVPGWMWGVLAGVLVIVAVGIFALRKAEPAPIVATAIKPPSLSPSLSPPPAAADAKSIAVLPFANLSSEKENEFFADGVHDDVITNLAKIRDLKVISRTSVLAYRDPASRNLKKIAGELGVATILEGSIRRVGSKVHMNAQLIDARTDEHLWADTFDGDTSDIFALQASLAQKIAGALKATLTPGERALIERRPTQDQEAYDLYLRARAMFQERGERGNVADYEHIIAVYEQAVARDKAFALAQSQVALVHSIMYWFGFLDPTPARAEKMKAAVDAAVRLAPDAPETHLALGAYHYRVSRDWSRALAEFRLAEAGLPNDAQLIFWLAITHRRLGKWPEALGYFTQSVRLNPRDFAPVGNYVGFLVSLRRWSQAADEANRFLDYFPAEGALLDNQAAARFALNGDRAAYANAIAALPRVPEDPSGVGDAFRAACLRGDYAAADRVLADAKLTALTERGSTVINDPVTFHRTQLAFLRGDSAAARQLADQAIAFYRESSWNSRQLTWVRMRIAMGNAWSGRADEAVREGEAALVDMSAQDSFDAPQLRRFLGEIYLAVGRRENAIALLQQMMSEPCALSPNAIRIDPLWSRLKDDPRFEEILRSAKPL